MDLRPPAYPLITVDPYFSVWSMTDKLTDSATRHWTDNNNTITGIVEIDGIEYRFMGDDAGYPAIEQIYCNVDALTTEYKFKTDSIVFTALFSSQAILADLDSVSRPVSFLKTDYISIDGKLHNVKVKINVSEELCLNEKGQHKVVTSKVENLTAMKMGSAEQNPLNKSGDNIRIDWGYVYLAVSGENTFVCSLVKEEMNYISAAADCGALFVFAYDDFYSIQYFGDNLKAYWKRNGITVEEVIKEAIDNYEITMTTKVKPFAVQLFADAVRAGGEKYAELLELAYRQVIAAHKLVTDLDGNILYISKECFSNGCAATVDVSFPSTPLFLIFNPELVNGMMRPIYRYARGGVWPFNFAPHDCGQYPLLNGQVYSKGTDPSYQMPIEESGNMLIMSAAVSLASGDVGYAESNMDLLKIWADYLVENGSDPVLQLCTDDFGGHLEHMCNLAVKAIMGIASYSLLCKLTGDEGSAQIYMEAAQKMADNWCVNAANEDGSFRLTFDRPGTFSMKYNAVWDKLFGTKLFPKSAIRSEMASIMKHLNQYGLPLDNRNTYTKSDWMAWTGVLFEEKADFARYIEHLWNAYNSSPSRVPMTDFFDTKTSIIRGSAGMRHRSVQGGLFIKLLEYKNKILK